MRSFQGAVAVVTGAGSGIGRSTALALGRRGARVHVVDRDGDRANAVCRELGDSGSAHPIDCTDADAMAALVEAVYAQDGRVDLLQNGVGVLVAAPVTELTIADWRRVMDVNLMSAVHGTQLFLPRMLAQGRGPLGGKGQIVNIASIAGLVAFPYTAPYSASKFALVGMSQALSCELAGTGIGVTVVCPGMVRSRLIADGTLRLPDPWPRIFDRAYATIAEDPDRIARAILRAVERDQPLVVPALLLPQLWRLERLGGGAFHRGARQLTRSLRGLGSWVASRRSS